nr:MAG TPA: hypothetical protein [Caudoviricetes sp.]
MDIQWKYGLTIYLFRYCPPNIRFRVRRTIRVKIS